MRHHDTTTTTITAGCTGTSGTGAVIGRRSWLRMAVRLGAAAGTLQLVGCGGDSPTSPSATTSAATTAPATTTATLSVAVPV